MGMAGRRSDPGDTHCDPYSGSLRQLPGFRAMKMRYSKTKHGVCLRLWKRGRKRLWKVIFMWD